MSSRDECESAGERGRDVAAGVARAVVETHHRDRTERDDEKHDQPQQEAGLLVLRHDLPVRHLLVFVSHEPSIRHPVPFA